MIDQLVKSLQFSLFDIIDVKKITIQTTINPLIRTVNLPLLIPTPQEPGIDKEIKKMIRTQCNNGNYDCSNLQVGLRGISFRLIQKDRIIPAWIREKCTAPASQEKEE